MAASNDASEAEMKMKEDEVLACAFGAWYPTFAGVTFKSEIISLPESFVQYLNADGINMGGRKRRRNGASNIQRDDDSSESSSDDDDEDEDEEQDADNEESSVFNFPELEDQIAASIRRLGGKVLPKLNWSAPKDAQWINGSLLCTSPRDVVMTLKASDFIAHDLAHSFDHCSCERKRPDEFTLVLRTWRELHESNEFRCFVANQKLIAISQRNTSGFFEHLCQEDERQALQESILDFFEENVKFNFCLERYVMDVYVAAAPRRKVRLVDFSPWGPGTDACLFDWSEVPEVASKVVPTGAPVDFRVVEGERERQSKVERYSQIPLELAQLSAGQGLDEFLKKADSLLAEQRREGQQ